MVHRVSAQFTTAEKLILNYSNCKTFVDGPPKLTFLETKIWRTLLHKEMNNEERNEQWKKWTSILASKYLKFCILCKVNKHIMLAHKSANLSSKLI